MTIYLLFFTYLFERSDAASKINVKEEKLNPYTTDADLNNAAISTKFANNEVENNFTNFFYKKKETRENTLKMVTNQRTEKKQKTRK